MPARTSRMRHWSAVNLSPDMPTRFPGVEEPGPKLPFFTEIALQTWPKPPYFAGGDEGENIIRLGLTHQLPHEIGANLRIGIAETLPEFVKSHLGIPEKVRMSFRIH